MEMSACLHESRQSSADQAKAYLSHEELETEDERPVYKAALSWVNHDPEGRRRHLPELLGAMRLALLPAVFLTEKVRGEELIRAQAGSKELVDRAIRCKLRRRGAPGGGARPRKTLDCYDPALDAWNSITTVPYSLIPTAFVSTWKQLPA